MLTFTVNLAPYQRQMRALESELNTVSSAFQQLPFHKLGTMSTREQLHFAVLANNTAEITAAEFDQIWHEYWQLEDALSQLFTLLTGKNKFNKPKRPKRAILGFMAPI